MYLLFDIGGTNTRLAISHDLERIAVEDKFSTPQSYTEAIEVISNRAEQLAARASKLLADAGTSEITAIAGGLPGILDKDNTKLLVAPNLPKWKNRRFGIDLAKNLSGNPKVKLANDVDLLALGEVSQPHFKDYQVIGYLALGTGVGGSLIHRGKTANVNLSFEPGHQIVNISENRSSTLEELCGGASIEQETGKLPDQINDEYYWRSKHKLLAIGVYNAILHWSPQVFILGGGLIERETYKVDLVTKYLSEINKVLPSLPEIVASELGDDAGLIGAMETLKDE